LRLAASRHPLIPGKNRNLPPDQRKGILWQMKLRTDLLEHLTDQDILEEVLANNHRYKPEPLFSKTGVGSLSPATIEERAQEIARSTALIARLKKRQRESKRKNNSKSSPSTKP
jgi:hypothetical protein